MQTEMKAKGKPLRGLEQPPRPERNQRKTPERVGSQMPNLERALLLFFPNSGDAVTTQV